MAYRKAMHLGIALRSPDVFEKLNSIQSLFFDKTGTVTEGQLKLVYHWPEEINEELKLQILSLEKISYHPVAFSFRDAWGKDLGRDLLNVQNHEEKFGAGVRGVIEGHLYEIKSLAQNTHEDDIGVGLYKNSQCVGRFYFQDQVRDDSAEVINHLQKMNMNTFMLTGDKKGKALKVAESVGIPLKNGLS